MKKLYLIYILQTLISWYYMKCFNILFKLVQRGKYSAFFAAYFLEELTEDSTHATKSVI